MRGFASAQRAYENMEPANTECDCETLYACGNCGEFSTEAKECTECTEGSDEVWSYEEVERTEDTEGILTDSACRIHNHECSSRHCCD